MPKTKDKDSENMYDLDDKLHAVEVLRQCRFDYDLASVRVGVPVPTLKEYARRLLPAMGGSDRAMETARNAPDDEIDEGFTRITKETRYLMLERMRDLVNSETDLDKVTKALKALHEISTSKEPWLGERPESATKYYQQINNLILNVSKDEKN